MNLHNLVRPAIRAVNPDETVTLYLSKGQRNVSGKVTPIYHEPVEVIAQVQPDSDAALSQQNNTNQTNIRRKIFMDSTSLPQGLLRQSGRGGDMIQRGDGSWWLVVAMPDDYTPSGWVSLQVSQQVNAPNFSASDWYVPTP